MVQKFRRPQLSQTKDNAIDLSPAPLTAPKFGQKSGWPTPSVNRKARKKGIPPRRLLQCYRHPIFSVSPFFSGPPETTFGVPVATCKGAGLSAIPPNKHVTRIDFPANLRRSAKRPSRDADKPKGTHSVYLDRSRNLRKTGFLRRHFCIWAGLAFRLS